LDGVALAEEPVSKSPSLVRVAEIPLGGNTTRLDHESLDQGRHLLFIAHLGDSAVIVFDTELDIHPAARNSSHANGV
jgi:hypothetical protein